jgi:ABC-type multidrug transport system ATPase subunit
MELPPTISTQGLPRRFGELLAVENIELRVLGPNGAGKSTTIKMLTGS